MKILVTAGPTREAIDPVRFISNRSSGKMGYAIAAAAQKRGHRVRLISGPVALGCPKGVRRIPVLSAEEMRVAVEREAAWCRALVMAAAVADWRPKRVSPRKLKKRRMPRSLPLERTPDILQCIAGSKGRRLFVGFAAETDHLLAEAQRKLRAKKLDLLVANDVSRPDSGFDVDTNKVWFVTPDEAPVEFPVMSKAAVARRIVEWIEREDEGGRARKTAEGGANREP